MPPTDTNQSVQKAQSILDKLVEDNIIDRTLHSIFLSKYKKAIDVLTQSLQNEAVHLNHLQDLTTMIETTEQTLQSETRKQSAVAQQILRLRTELSERESCIVTLQDDYTKLSAEETMLMEEKTLLEHELTLRRNEYAESLRPRIAALEMENKGTRDSIASMEAIESNLQAEIALSAKQLDTLVSANNVIEDELRKITTDKQRAGLLPEKYQRQAALVQQALNAAQVDAQKREKRYNEVQGSFESAQASLENINKEIANICNQYTDLRSTALAACVKETEQHTKELRQIKTQIRTLTEENAVLMLKEKTTKAAKQLDLSNVDNLNKQIKAQQKKIQRVEALIARNEEALEPVQKQLKDVAEEISTEKNKAKVTTSKVEAVRGELHKKMLLLANSLNVDDDFSKKLLGAADCNKKHQQTVNEAAAESRELAVQIKVCQSAQQAETSRLAKLNSNLKQLISELQVKDTEADRLSIELHNLESRMADFSIMYEQLKTQKNRLARLSQEAKLAISEIQKKIAVLTSESELLSNESREKSNLLSRQAIDTKDARRKASQMCQKLADQKRILRNLHEEVEQHVSEIESLGSLIANAEQQLFQLRNMYIEAVEQRNYAGIQLVERNDELCMLYERLHTQENILRDAEIFMSAREEDLRVLNIMYKELENERNIVRKDVTTDLPKLIEERASVLQELAEARADNEQLLLDIRGGACVKDDAKVEILDLTNIYDPQRAVKPADPDEILLTNVIDALDDGQGSNELSRTASLKKLNQPLPRIGSLSAGSAGTKSQALDKSATQKQAIRKRTLGKTEPLMAKWNMVGATEPVSQEKLLAKQRTIEGRMQTVRETLLEKFIFNEELDRLIAQLQEDIEAAKRAVPAEITTKLNSTRTQLRGVTRKLMAMVSEVSMEQATIMKLKAVAEQLEDTVVAAKERLNMGLAPTDEIEHEWLIAHQHEVEYQHSRMLLEQELASQVPGLVQTTAKPRFDSYMSQESGLPRPYGGRAPFAPADPAPNISRFIKKPGPVAIEI